MNSLAVTRKAKSDYEFQDKVIAINSWVRKKYFSIISGESCLLKPMESISCFKYFLWTASSVLCLFLLIVQ